MLKSAIDGNTTRLESTFELDETGLGIREHQTLTKSGVPSLLALKYTNE